MLDKSKTYLIVGLGLLGGKYAQVLSQKGYHVTGITHSQSTLDYALQHDYIRAGKNADFEDLVREAGLHHLRPLPYRAAGLGQTVRPTHPPRHDGHGCVRCQARCGRAGAGRPAGGCGIYRQPPDGGPRDERHRPQRRGPTLPRKLHHHPDGKNSQAGIDWCRDLAVELGFKRISVLTPAEHDHMIGYVSQLCHAIAVS